MLELQGDTVLVALDKKHLLMSIIRMMDEPGGNLFLVNDRKRLHETWPLAQELVDLMVLNKTPEAKWFLNLETFKFTDP